MVTVESSDGETVITTSDEHPFYVKDKGWIRADELNNGYELVSLENDDDRLIVKNNQRLETSMQMYNLEVEDFNTYAVSEQQIWVHNECLKGTLNLSDRWKTFDGELTMKGNVLNLRVDMIEATGNLRRKDFMDVIRAAKDLAKKKGADKVEIDAVPAAESVQRIFDKFGSPISGANGIYRMVF